MTYKLRFEPPIKLYYSQTTVRHKRRSLVFEPPIKLYYSQTLAQMV